MFLQHYRLQAPLSMDSQGKNTRLGCHAFLQGLFPTQGSKLRLLRLLYWKASSLSLPPPKLGSWFYWLQWLPGVRAWSFLSLWPGSCHLVRCFSYMTCLHPQLETLLWWEWIVWGNMKMFWVLHPGWCKGKKGEHTGVKGQRHSWHTAYACI